MPEQRLRYEREKNNLNPIAEKPDVEGESIFFFDGGTKPEW